MLSHHRFWRHFSLRLSGVVIKISFALRSLYPARDAQHRHLRQHARENGHFAGVACSTESKPVPSGAAGNAVAEDGVNPCKGKPFDVTSQLELRVKKEIPSEISPDYLFVEGTR
jgi:hypothetical protein